MSEFKRAKTEIQIPVPKTHTGRRRGLHLNAPHMTIGLRPDHLHVELSADVEPWEGRAQ